MVYGYNLHIDFDVALRSLPRGNAFFFRPLPL